MLNFLKAMKKTANVTVTENGAVTPRSTGSDCLNLFSTIGALRTRSWSTCTVTYPIGSVTFCSISSEAVLAISGST